VWAGVDSAWEQEKPEARKMLENAAESHTSGARFVSQPACLPEPLLWKITLALVVVLLFQDDFPKNQA